MEQNLAEENLPPTQVYYTTILYPWKHLHCNLCNISVGNLQKPFFVLICSFPFYIFPPPVLNFFSPPVLFVLAFFLWVIFVFVNNEWALSGRPFSFLSSLNGAQPHLAPYIQPPPPPALPHLFFMLTKQTAPVRCWNWSSCFHSPALILFDICWQFFWKWCKKRTHISELHFFLRSN